LEVHFVNPELERLYTDGDVEETYPAELVRVFQRSIRCIEAARDPADLALLPFLEFASVDQNHEGMNSIKLLRGWQLLVAEERAPGTTIMRVHEIIEDGSA
jgi:plasmid maintenance system killer protein